MRKQQGVTLSGLLIVSIILIAVAVIGFKLFPAYAEYLKVKKAVTDIARNPEYNKSIPEMRAAFGRRATIDDIRAVQDLDITRQGDRAHITANWSVKVPLFYNVSACMDFEAKSE
jgi:Tfp pilus assembly major pilin PilA